MRKIILYGHLLIAAFVAPMFIMLAVSGGLYLLGEKGDTEEQPIELVESATLDFASTELAKDVAALLQASNYPFQFEYIKDRGDYLQTRPTSRDYLEFSYLDNELVATLKQPSLQKQLIELHKGHGPLRFKTYQKGVAIALLLSVLSGLYMGLANPRHRRKTSVAVVLGTLVFLVLGFG